MRKNHGRRGSYGQARNVVLAGVVALLAAGCGGSDDDDDEQTTPPPAGRSLSMTTVSSPPEYVSGGDALVQVQLPDGVSGPPTVTLNGNNVSRAFADQGQGRWQGLVEGIDLGDNTLEAKAGDASGTLTVTGYPITGPMLSGPHQRPFVCTLTTFGRLGGGTLDGPLDADCSANTRIDYFYRRTGGGNARWNNPTTHPADMSYLTIDAGKPTERRVAYLVRLETGTINRGIYQSAMLHDPLVDGPIGPNKHSAGWNGKLIYPLGGGCQGGWYTQGDTFGSLINDEWMQRGYAAVTSTLNIFGSNCNDLLSSETVAMTKERFIEAYGVPTYTIGTGGSGGAYQSFQTSDNYPGLFDGIIVNSVFPDVTSATLFKVFDSRLLQNYFTRPGGLAYSDDKKKAISGYLQVGNIAAMSGSAGRLDPLVSFPASFPAELKYNPATNPTGSRATVYDHTVNVYGKDERGFALRPIDNVGVQYGLQAFNSGAITADEFLDLNQNIGGLDADLKPTAQRTTGDLPAIRRAYQSGRITNGGGGLAGTAILERRDYFDNAVAGDIHNKIHSYSVRERLKKANGSFDNHVMLGPGTVPVNLFDIMDTWLMAAVDGDPETSKSERIIGAKPADLVDACWDAGGAKIEEPSTPSGGGQCNTLYPAGTTPRMVAGGPLADDIVKCQLKPIDPADYAVVLTGPQLTRLQGIFPEGVCDWSKPGVEQQGLQGTWLSFGPSTKKQVFDVSKP
ncbi:DUF6351 family protein [Bordetella genomosp. 13]|uniref:DUF6351 family protein n=1 Tax=Bordetella genomosp. 13 TaxID=463040 RepID=UPI00119CFE08|nr:DUF6351 family protein [Bordetella genomosp. 13]